MNEQSTPGMLKRICVFTSSRAEYGLLVPIIRGVQQSEVLELQLIVSGSHLSDLHGHTADLIRADGFTIDATIEMLLASDSVVAVTKSIGIALMDLATQLDRLRPDILVVLGDRYELIAAATAAMIQRIPVAHVHGGEETEGAFDDLTRHAVTKMSHIHFATAKSFAQRIIQMGEDPANVHVVQAPALDTIGSISMMSRANLEELIGEEFGRTNILVSYHPATASIEESPSDTINSIIEACSSRADRVFLCAPNADPESAGIRHAISKAVSNKGPTKAIPAVGHRAFLSLIAESDVFVGNSSSGIIEAPSLRTPVVLVGRRQEGRPLADSIISTTTNPSAIGEAIDAALSEEFRAVVNEATSPYERGVSAAAQIVEVLERTDPLELTNKRFYTQLHE